MKFRAGKTEFVDTLEIPEMYREELEAVLETLEAIHGKGAVAVAKFMMNITSMLDMIVQNTTLDEGCQEEDMREMINKILNSLLHQYGQALKVKKVQMEAAVNTVATLKNLVQTYEKEVNAAARKKRKGT
jgi:hypothetical protein